MQVKAFGTNASNAWLALFSFLGTGFLRRVPTQNENFVRKVGDDDDDDDDDDGGHDDDDDDDDERMMMMILMMMTNG
eukprot:476549-Amphidinium_carterae.1